MTPQKVAEGLNTEIIERLVIEITKKDREIQQKVFDEVCWSLIMSGDFSQTNIDKEIKKSLDKIKKEKENETD